MEDRGLASISYHVGDEVTQVDLREPEFVFGRSNECDAVLAFQGVSRNHFAATRDGESWCVRDLESLNGTFVNHQRVENYRLRDGDQITLGRPGLVPVTLVFHQRIANPRSEETVVFDEADGLPSLDAVVDVEKTAGPDSNDQSLVSLFSNLGDAVLLGDDLSGMLERVLDLAFDHLPAQRGAICLWDAAAQELTPQVSRRGTSKAAINISRSIASAVIQGKKAVLVNDAGGDDRFGGSQSIAEIGIKSVMCAPMFRSGTVLGVVYLDMVGSLGTRSATFDEGHLETLAAMGVFAAAGIEKARLLAEYHEEQRERMLATSRIRVLLDVAKSLSSNLDTTSLIKTIVQRARELLDAEVGSLFVVDRERGELWSKVAENTDEIRIPMSKGIAGHVATTGEVLNIPDAYADGRFNPEIDRKTGFRTRSILCMPLKNKDGDVLGVTQIINKRGGPFDQEDEEIMGAFSAQAAVALENALLFQETLEMRNYLQSVLKSINSHVLTLDNEGRLVTSNHDAAALLGIDEATMRTVPYTEWYDSANGALVDGIGQVFDEQPSPVDVSDYELDVAGKKSSVNFNIMPLLDFEESQKGAVIVLDDVTQQKRVMNTLSRHLGPAVAQQVLADGEDRLGGVRQEITVLFSDIRGYTSLTESLDATEVVEMLNEYFSEMVDPVLAQRGVLDKYIGDAIMAVFGVPFAEADDSQRACVAALGMKRALAELNARRKSAGKSTIEIGIGLNSGAAISGNIGSEKRLEYTCIGDGVNLASRLEGVTKVYGVMILVSEATHKQLSDDFITRELDVIRVKGKQQPIRIYELLGASPADVPAHLLNILPHFGAGLEAYKKREFQAALEHFATADRLAPDDKPTQLFICRCQQLQQKLPPADWDGVWEMTEK